jgi:bacillithiol system protein YtxJ
VISLLGKFTAPQRVPICYPENMVIELRQDRDLEELLERSKTNPVLIFKHSTQCPISAYSYKEFKAFADSSSELACGLVLVIENRSLSNTIAERLQVRHESPQAIIVKDGRATWHASHWSVTTDSLSEAVAKRKRDNAQPQVKSNGEPAHQRN